MRATGLRSLRQSQGGVRVSYQEAFRAKLAVSSPPFIEEFVSEE